LVFFFLVVFALPSLPRLDVAPVGAERGGGGGGGTPHNGL